jgi:hypothetical protein
VAIVIAAAAIGTADAVAGIGIAARAAIVAMANAANVARATTRTAAMPGCPSSLPATATDAAASCC